MKFFFIELFWIRFMTNENIETTKEEKKRDY